MALKPGGRETRSTGMVMPTKTWELLRGVVFKSTRRSVGRGPVPALLAELVNRHEAELEQDLASASR